MDIDEDKILSAAVKPPPRGEAPRQARTAEMQPRSIEELRRSVHVGDVHLPGSEVQHDAPQRANGTPEATVQQRTKELAAANMQLLREIDERKRVEEALRESEACYRALFEAAAEGIAVAEVESRRFVRVNAAFCRMLGYTREELFTLGVEDIHPAERLAYVLDEFHAQARGEKVLSVEVPCVRKDGSIIYADIATSAIKVDGTVCNVGYFIDVTERKRMHRALQDSAERFNQVAESAGGWIWEVDAEGLYTYVSPAVEKILGYTPQEIVDRLHFYDLLAPEKREKDKRAAFSLSADKKPFGGVVRAHLRKDGGRVILESSGVPKLDGQGCPIGYRGVNTDITERKHTEEQIRQLDLLKGSLIGPQSLTEKLTRITAGVVEVFAADFARIWLIREGDLCAQGCLHAAAEGPDACRDRSHCLHLAASSGRYTHIDGPHRRIPFGCYKVGRIATGEECRFITHDVAHDPQIRDHAWARALGLTAFAGFRIFSEEGEAIGVLALFSKRATTAIEEGLLAGLANYLSQVILSDRAREALLASEIKFRALFENANDAIFLLKNGIFIDCNARALAMFRCARGQLIGQPPLRFSPPFQPDGRASAEKAQEIVAAAQAGHALCFEWQHLLDDGTLFDAEVNLNCVDLGGERFHQTIVRDVTERKQVERALEQSNRKLEVLSLTDGLTGIANRRRFDEVLSLEYARHVRSRAELSLILLDIDHFKAFNDYYGHISGDACLRQIAQVIARSAARPADLAARYGGEEFACILPETDCIGAVAMAEKIRREIMALAIPHERSAVADFVTVSLGVVTARCAGGGSAMDLVARGDERLYQAKSGGRNRVEFIAAETLATTSTENLKDSLMRLVWKDSFSSGNPVIDSQHQSLFHLSNELLAAILATQPATEIAAIIARLVEEVGQHFHDEEAILETVGFPGLAQHKEEHARLQAEGLRLSQGFAGGTCSVGAVSQFLVYEVVLLHLLGADREFVAYTSAAITEGKT